MMAEIINRPLEVGLVPVIVESASRVLQGTNLSIYGENGQLLDQLAPIFEFLARSVQQATQDGPQRAPVPDRGSPVIGAD
jgi:hypothetical protein